MRQKNQSILGRIAIAVSLSAAMAGCATNSGQQKITSLSGFYEFASRHGDIPRCRLQGKSTIMFPGMGGDTMVVAAGKSAIIIDEGDNVSGPTLDVHDRVIIVNARPDQFIVEQNGSSLLLCSHEQNISVVIVRQFCSGAEAEGRWNNSVEEITFSSGETWLSDDLYRSYLSSNTYITREMLEKYSLKGLTEFEISRWRIAPMSEKLPSVRMTDRSCRAERREYLRAAQE